MLELTRGNIRQITETVDKAEVTFSHLRDDLIDHMCCEIETEMKQGNDFQNAFEKIKTRFGIKDLQKVQEQTLLLIDKNYCKMKQTMKISGILSTSLLMFASLFKLNHWPFANIMLILGFIILCLFFLPSANYVINKERKDGNLTWLLISAIIGSFGFFSGLLFKLMHWPGANILLLIGLSVLAFLFLPILLIYRLKKAENSNLKTLYVFGVLSGIIYLVGLLSKLMQWPGASLMLATGAVFLILVFIPAYTIHKYRNETYIQGSYLYLIAAISWFVLFSMLMSINTSKPVLYHFYKENQLLKESIALIKVQNKSLIATLSNDSVESDIKEIDRSTHVLYDFIERTKIDIIKYLPETNQAAINKNGTLDIEKIDDIMAISPVQSVMLGSNDSGKAYELHKQVQKYQEQLTNYCVNDPYFTSLLNSLLETSDTGGLPQSQNWEEHTFKHIHVIACLNILSAWQRNILLAENETITYLAIHQE